MELIKVEAIEAEDGEWNKFWWTELIDDVTFGMFQRTRIKDTKREWQALIQHAQKHFDVLRKEMK